MSSPSESFDELWQRLRGGRGLTNTGDDPVYYLVFKPEQMLEVKRLRKQWAARLAKQAVQNRQAGHVRDGAVLQGLQLQVSVAASPGRAACSGPHFPKPSTPGKLRHGALQETSPNCG